MNRTAWSPPGSRMNSLGLTSVQVTTSVCRLVMVAWPRLPAGSKPVASILMGIAPPPVVRHHDLLGHHLPRLGVQLEVRRGNADAQVLRRGRRRSQGRQRHQDPTKRSREEREIAGDMLFSSFHYEILTQGTTAVLVRSWSAGCRSGSLHSRPAEGSIRPERGRPPWSSVRRWGCRARPPPASRWPARGSSSGRR